jgi:diguanylate cyclase (GGDEF)-like protein
MAYDVSETLERLVASTRQATGGLGVVLVLSPSTPAARRVFSSGIDLDLAQRLAAQLTGEDADFGGPVVPVADDRRRYGYLALWPPAGVVTEDQLEVAQAHAMAAGSALSATAELADARERAEAMSQLLALSNELAEATALDDVAVRIALSMPGLLRCDQAVVVVRDPNLPIGRLAAVHGFPPETTDRLQRLVVSMFDHTVSSRPVLHQASDDPGSELDRCMLHSGAIAWLTMPLVSGDEAVGVLVAGVGDDSERLSDERLPPTTLHGLHLQAAAALRRAAVFEQAAHDVLRDGLTGLANRALFLDRVERVLARIRRTGTAGAVLVVDVDRFGELNQRVGRGSGDLLLRGVASRLVVTLRRSDSLARLGGDGFGAVLEGGGGFPVERAAERMLSALRHPFTVETQRDPLSVSASVGIAPIDDGADAGTLLAYALEAAQAASAAGGDRLAVHVAGGA